MNKHWTITPITITLIVIVSILSILQPTPVNAANTQPATAAHVRLLVKQQPDSIFAAQALPSATTTHMTPLGWDVVEVDADIAAQLLAHAPQDGSITPDHPLELAWTPNDPALLNNWQWALPKLGAELAWEFSKGEEIIIAVADSGIDYTHPEFAGRIVEGYNFYDDTTNAYDGCGHGTHVAGIIAAAADNGIGIAGLAPQARIMPLKVIDDSCAGSYSRLMEAIVYAVDHGVRIISITSGGGFDHEGLHAAIQYARSQGVFVAVASGNRGNDEPFYPGSYAEAVTIAGTTATDEKFILGNFGQQVDFAAPAVGIYSTFRSENGEPGYTTYSGTSMATPYVAAVAALILAQEPTLPLATLEAKLRETVVDLGEPGWDPIFGWGRVNAARAAATLTAASGNVKQGHIRVPQMAVVNSLQPTATVHADGLRLAWQAEPAVATRTVVIYRSESPTFESALDIAEIPSSDGSYIDTTAAIGMTYTYWLVQSDSDIEFAISPPLTITRTAPQEPVAPSTVTLFIPMVRVQG